MIFCLMYSTSHQTVCVSLHVCLSVCLRVCVCVCSAYIVHVHFPLRPEGNMTWMLSEGTSLLYMEASLTSPNTLTLRDKHQQRFLAGAQHALSNVVLRASKGPLVVC